MWTLIHVNQVCLHVKKIVLFWNLTLDAKSYLFFPLPDYGKNYGSTHFTETCIQGNVFSWGPFLDVPYQDNTLSNGSFLLSYITSRFCTWSLVWNSRLFRWFLCHLLVAYLHFYYVSGSDNTETEQVKKSFYWSIWATV